MPDTREVERILAQRQTYFVPYYCEIVELHPEGIDSAEVKRQVAQLLVERFEIDIRNEALFGSNVNGSRADQWANNLVSNRGVLDPHMLVARRGRGQPATLYPGTTDNSRLVAPAEARGLAPTEVEDLNQRPPSTMQSSSGTTYRRSFDLAQHVRRLNEFRCAIDGRDCVRFEGRDGRPYVEVHHIVPMAIQSGIGINLDRTLNMAPLCPGCHSCLHRGSATSARVVVVEMLSWFERTHSASFEMHNDDLGFGVSESDLMAMYGTMNEAG